uniref:E1_dh domain-containing protein n=1 Tax=Heterorhabditis bacteriophora TaxID=37862 RepID=A0A1I7WV53_HETBA
MSSLARSLKGYKLHKLDSGPPTSVSLCKEDALHYYREMQVCFFLHISSILRNTFNISYRTRDEIQEVRKTRDPITGFKDRLITSGLATEDTLKSIDKVLLPTRSSLHPVPPEEEGPPNYARPINAPAIQHTGDPMAAYGRDGTKAKKDRTHSISVNKKLITDDTQSTTENDPDVKNNYESAENPLLKQVSKHTKNPLLPTAPAEDGIQTEMNKEGKEVNGKQHRKKVQDIAENEDESKYDNENASKSSSNNSVVGSGSEKNQIKDIVENEDEIVQYSNENIDNSTPTSSAEIDSDQAAPPESEVNSPAYPYSKETVFSPSSSEADKIVSSIITTALPNIYKPPRGKIRNDESSPAPPTSAELREVTLQPYSTEESIESTEGSGVNGDKSKNSEETENQREEETASEEKDDLPSTRTVNGYEDNNFSGDDIENASSENSEASGTTIETLAENRSTEKGEVVEDRYVTGPEGSGEEQAEELTEQAEKSEELSVDKYMSPGKKENWDSTKKKEQSSKESPYSVVEGSAEDEESKSVETSTVNQEVAHKENTDSQSTRIDSLKHEETASSKNKANTNGNKDEIEERYSTESKIRNGETVDDLAKTETNKVEKEIVILVPSSKVEVLWTDAAGYDADKQSQGISTAKPVFQTKSPIDGPLVKVDSSTANDDIIIAYESQKTTKQGEKFNKQFYWFQFIKMVAQIFVSTRIL